MPLRALVDNDGGSLSAYFNSANELERLTVDIGYINDVVELDDVQYFATSSGLWRKENDQFKYTPTTSSTIDLLEYKGEVNAYVVQHVFGSTLFIQTAGEFNIKTFYGYLLNDLNISNDVVYVATRSIEDFGVGKVLYSHNFSEFEVLDDFVDATDIGNTPIGTLFNVSESLKYEKNSLMLADLEILLIAKDSMHPVFESECNQVSYLSQNTDSFLILNQSKADTIDDISWTQLLFSDVEFNDSINLYGGFGVKILVSGNEFYISNNCHESFSKVVVNTTTQIHNVVITSEKEVYLLTKDGVLFSYKDSELTKFESSFKYSNLFLNHEKDLVYLVNENGVVAVQ